VKPIWELHPQSDEQMRGWLFVGERFEIGP
jgi:hypothetical protein